MATSNGKTRERKRQMEERRQMKKYRVLGRRKQRVTD